MWEGEAETQFGVISPTVQWLGREQDAGTGLGAGAGLGVGSDKQMAVGTSLQPVPPAMGYRPAMGLTCLLPAHTLGACSLLHPRLGTLLEGATPPSRPRGPIAESRGALSPQAPVSPALWTADLSDPRLFPSPPARGPIPVLQLLARALVKSRPPGRASQLWFISHLRNAGDKTRPHLAGVTLLLHPPQPTGSWLSPATVRGIGIKWLPELSPGWAPRVTPSMAAVLSASGASTNEAQPRPRANEIALKAEVRALEPWGSPREGPPPSQEGAVPGGDRDRALRGEGSATVTQALLAAMLTHC